ncbi:MAG: peptidylprolyl isomerase [Sphingobacteriales bacterium]|jgi:peptidyl-prolyl cis-trans isomerase SurA|nr:MAG: peptidylprolyl isomerase [Sphingobacteriales bacterium]
MINKIICWTLCGFLSLQLAVAQNGIVLDKIDAIVADKIILKSDIENQMEIMNLRGEEEAENKCDLMYQMIFNKILTIQAERDSLPVGDAEVEDELDRKINYFVSMAGSVQAFEEHYKKNIEQIKDDFRDDIREQLYANQMRQKIVGEIKVTPSEVKSFFENLDTEDVPYFNAEVELLQIVVKPKVSEEQRQIALNKIKAIKSELDAGESFELKASLYSEDLGSAQEGGDLGWATRGSFVKEFEAVAFKLKPNEISDVVETTFGFHIIQLVERRGDQINLKHILIRPKSTSVGAELAYAKIDSIRKSIMDNKISFEECVKLYSEDEQSKNVGGAILDYETGNTIVEVKNLDPEIYKAVENLEVGKITEPNMFQTQDGTPAYRILKLISKSEPHVANLQLDYDRIQTAAINNKEESVMQKWLDKNMSKTYMMIDGNYKSCELLKDWAK